MESISQYLSEDLILFLDSNSKEEILDDLVEVLDQKKKLYDKKTFIKTILDRENLISTGISKEVAIPHAKQKPSRKLGFFIAIGIQKNGVDWNSLDNLPVKLIFLIVGPEDKQTEYLQLLASLTSIIRDEKIKEEILNLEAPEEIFNLFKKLDEEKS